MNTKDNIINYLKNYYNIHKKTPFINENHPFKTHIVEKLFGNWSNALTESNLPLNVNKSLEVICLNCNKKFTKLYSQVKKHPSHFCSQSCSASFNNKKRIVSDESNKKRSDTLKKLYKGKECINCKKIHFLRNRKTCSGGCLKEYKKIIGVEAGKKSAASQQRRSKAEILFADYCIDYFGEENVLTNVLYFKDKNNNYWDADIIIPNLKLSILYNGIWHYKKITKKHNLNQVQSRDILKQKIIKDNNFEYYIVKDLGKYDEEFIGIEFQKFIEYIILK